MKLVPATWKMRTLLFVVGVSLVFVTYSNNLLDFSTNALYHRLSYSMLGKFGGRNVTKSLEDIDPKKNETFVEKFQVKPVKKTGTGPGGRTVSPTLGNTTLASQEIIKKPVTGAVFNQTAPPQRRKVAKPARKRKRISKTSRPATVVKESPFAGDVYPTDNTYLNSECPDSIRKRVANISEYKDIFLETIPVLQWSKHATEAEYKRLSKHPGLYGWKVIGFDDLKDALSYLNTSANTVMFDDWEMRPNKSSNCIRCAVIGNGGILNNSNMGEEIDKHDYVFRVNGAIIKGYEKDVGKRTSFYNFATNTMLNSLRNYRRLGYTSVPKSEETRYIFVPVHARDYYMVKAAATEHRVAKGPERSRDPHVYFGPHIGPEKLKMYHADFMRYLRNRFLSSRIAKKYPTYRPTTGALMLLGAIHTCDQVSAYGFITKDYAKYANHYYDIIKKKPHFFFIHDMRLELELWETLHKYGIIRLFTRG
ncbi:alpha-N-acetylgalactosaminide alpha-2,6-sialyltransferase 2 [Callorhinchus milii]|uniref:alpha-N-acetylgalactosaminide alpha-2,6-sialyltransferase 2 n=1 Tax=Callorhinchus milii TaxID=7868 RepID=UPI000457242D|nr:alpha-N-acetylgalactosaminide alpha-2,6-sialyltransferase 2 [Callorhinchus milii]|eukprot:gi/632943291/ref/XP_007886870.1/ PREDICTED: alpha-N-acetylgalactosaminide alpha-2,6-sialyltransferase 2-like [Callorhinchus milii]